MARRLIAALALAHGASAFLEGFVDVLVRVDEVRSPVNVAAGVLEAAGRGDDPGYEACVDADQIVQVCYDAGALDSSTPVEEGDRCLCCDRSSNIGEVYSSCASYAINEVSATSAYSAMTVLYSICGIRATCATQTAGGPTRGSTRTTRATEDVLPTDLPAPCSSLLSIYSSCSDDLGFNTAKATDVAACFCPKRSGEFDTAFEDYASSCIPYAKSSFLPGDYTVVTRLATFCDAVQTGAASSSGPLIFTSAGTRSGPEFGLPSETTSPTTTGTAGLAPVPSDQTGESSSSSTGLGTPGVAVPGLFAWFANLATLFLSFFFLI